MQRRTRKRLAFAVLVGVALLPVAVGIAHTAGTHYLPSNDLAVTEFRVRDVGHRAVLVGSPSRFGWFHPGPLLIYALAVPYRLLGSSSAALQIGALLLNGGAIAGIAIVARRRGGLPLVACALSATLLLVGSFGADHLRSPWNPDVEVVPLLLLVLLAWSASVGDFAALPWAVGVASFMVQSHVGLAPVSLALLLWALAAAVVMSLRAPGDPESRRVLSRRLVRWATLAAAVGVVLWLPPLYDQLLTRNHNLGELWSYARRTPGDIDVRTVLGVIFLQLGPRPEWVFGAAPHFSGFAPVPAALPVPILLLLGAAATTVGALLRRRDVVLLAASVGIALVGSFLGVQHISGGLFDYLVRYTWAIGAALGILVLWAAYLALARAKPRMLGRAALVLAAVGVLALGVSGTIDAATVEPYQSKAQPELRAISAQLVCALPSRGGPVLFHRSGGLAQYGIALQLERRGIPVRFESGTLADSTGRAAHGGPHRAEVRVFEGRSRPGTPTDPRDHVLARWSLTPSRDERAALDEIATFVARMRREYEPTDAKVLYSEARLRDMQARLARTVEVIGHTDSQERACGS